jgi:acetyl esterase/lipase
MNTSSKNLAATSPGVERQTRAFLHALYAGGGVPIETLPPAEARGVLASAQAGAEVALPPSEVSEKVIREDGQDLRLNMVRPKDAQGVLPAFMFFHGGGWILGDFPTHERLVRDVVADSGAAAVFVNYTPSPEARYPVAIHQAYAAARWVAEHGSEVGVDGKRLALVGNSVGGTMATVVALMAKEKGTPAIRAQILLWPATNAGFENKSYDEFAEGHFLTRSMMKWFWDAYTTDPGERQEVYASPLLATPEQLQGLPPALILTAEKDVLRDEGEAYARKLDAAGVAVVSTRYNGMIHDFGLLNALSAVPATRAALHQVSEELRARLN